MSSSEVRRDFLRRSCGIRGVKSAERNRSLAAEQRNIDYTTKAMKNGFCALAVISLLAPWGLGCSEENKGSEEDTTPTGVPTSPGSEPSPSSPSSPNGEPTAGPTPTSPTAPTTTTPDPTGPNPTATAPTSPGPTPTAPSPTAPTEPGPAPTEPGPAPTEPGPAPTEPGPAPTVPTEPQGPPAGAYEACSGAAPPALTLTPVLEGLSSPIHAVTPKGDPSTMFVVQRGGRLLRFDLSQANPQGTEILSVTTTTSGECGFLSAALHPNFDGVSENRLYVSYINGSSCGFSTGQGSPGRLDEYVVEGDSASFSRTILDVEQPEGNHNGGLVAFGPDGYLYFGFGDGGGSNDNHGPNGNGQNVSVLLGKLLRLDVDDLDSPPSGNLTSADVGGANVDGRILHYGLRNPWRFSFDRVTGDLYIGDVGQNTREEISFAPAGSGPLNFGWAAREGKGACSSCSGKSLLAGTTATDPIHDYPTNSGLGSGFFNGSVTGGFVYRGQKIPGLWGRYIYADYVHSSIYALTYDGEGGVCDTVDSLIPGASIPQESLASFAEDADGELYVVNMSRGTILRIDPQ